MKLKTVTLIKDDSEETLGVVHYTKGPFLESSGCLNVKLTSTRVRKIIAALMPYAEWTPRLYRPPASKEGA